MAAKAAPAAQAVKAANARNDAKRKVTLSLGVETSCFLKSDHSDYKYQYKLSFCNTSSKYLALQMQRTQDELEQQGLWTGVIDPQIPWSVEDYKALEILEQNDNHRENSSTEHYLKLDDESLPAHPRIRVNATVLKVIAAAAARDGGAKAVLTQLTAYGETLLTKALVNCTRAGVEDSLLGQARDTLDRAYSLGLLYRLTKDAKWADRLRLDLLNVAVNCTSWNPSHFLDVAEMTHAV